VVSSRLMANTAGSTISETGDPDYPASGCTRVLGVVFAETTTADWITAIGSAFAAVGTVGAVIVALWQTKRRDGYKVHVTCRIGYTGDAEIGNLVTLEATNTGERLVKLTMAYLLNNENKTIVAKFFRQDMQGLTLARSIEQGPLPASLVDGENIAVSWRHKTLTQIKEKEGFDHYVCAYFTDPLGNMYSAPYPGVKLKRRGWLWRRREYVIERRS
jgi:hypothetical protein